MKKVQETEASILQGIRSMLSMQGWWVFRHHQSLGSLKGFPDLTAIRGGITVYIEVKGPKGKLSAHQAEIGRRISEAGGVYIVARSVQYVAEICDSLLIQFGGLSLKPVKGMRVIAERGEL